MATRWFYPQPSTGDIVRILRVQVCHASGDRVRDITVWPAASKGHAPELLKDGQTIQVFALHVVPYDDHDGLYLFPVDPVHRQTCLALLVAHGTSRTGTFIHELEGFLLATRDCQSHRPAYRAPSCSGRALPDVVDFRGRKRVCAARSGARPIEDHLAVQTMQLGRHLALFRGKLLGEGKLPGRRRLGALKEERAAEKVVNDGGRDEAFLQDARVAAGAITGAEPCATAGRGGAREKTYCGFVDEAEMLLLVWRVGGTDATQPDQIPNLPRPVQVGEAGLILCGCPASRSARRGIDAEGSVTCLPDGADRWRETGHYCP